MRPGPGLVVMALAFISGARRGSTSTSQQKLSSLSSSSLSSSSSFSSSSSSPKSSLLLSPTSEYHYYQHQQEQHLPLEQRTRSNRYPSSPSSSSSSSTAAFTSSSSKSSSSSYSLFHSFGSAGSLSDTSQQHPSSSLSSDYRNTFTIYNYDRNTDEIEQKYHFDNFKLDKLSYVNVEDYGENTEEISLIGRSGGVVGGGGGSGGSGGSSSWSDDAAEYDDREQDSEFFPGSVPSHSHIFESTSSLSRVNPWLSACDLAQPSSAPDLQGQCTAGSLPVAWVDEGPGPPSCPMSCEQLNLDSKHNYNSNTNTNSYNSNNNNNYNTLHNYDNNYLINMNNNNNFNPVNNIMSKVRREIVEKSAGLVRPASAAGTVRIATTTTNNGAPASIKKTPSSSQITTIKPPGVVERTTTTVSTASMNANKMVADKTVETTYNFHRQHQQELQFRNRDLAQHQDQDQYEDIMLNDANANAQSSSGSGSASTSSSSSSTQDHHYNYNNLDNYNNIVKNNLNNRKNVNDYNSYLNNNIYNSNNLNNDNSNQYNQNQNQQQQQCLDYLGDNDDSSPTQLCKNSRSDLDKKLRHLRLKHCCERTVLSALHTIALNVTLGGGPQCVRILTDIWDLDSLATRITCELAEILFRYDCRQIYSRIHQCKDCKEAYRRWVCSTLIPYFAEHSSTNSNKDSATTTKTTATSKSTNNNNANNKKQKEEHQQGQQEQELTDDQFQFGVGDNDENFDRDRFQQDSLSLYDDDEDESIESPHISKLLSSESSSTTLLRKSLTSAVIEQQQQQEQHSQHFLKKRAAVQTTTNCKRTNANIIISSNIEEQESSSSRQSLDSISTANNKDPCVEGSVISRLLTRTKRKIEFRKRRRIRPCRSVCETVEQKCPYLLPGDRAPAYPTQYAGEPTFLCLDQNIPETGEQLSKSNHGPPECCYRYCDPPTHGICIYCDDFDDGSGRRSPNTTTAANTKNNNNLRDNNTTLEERLGTSSSSSSDQISSDDLSSSKNSTAHSRSNATSIDSIDDLEKLPYYAYSGLVYYYDDIIDLPSDPLVECQPVASVTSRCTMPYYASSAMATRYKRFGSNFDSKQRFVLIWSSIICFLVQNNILVTVHIPNDSNYRFYYYCCYNLNDWWRRLIGLLMFIISL